MEDLVTPAAGRYPVPQTAKDVVETDLDHIIGALESELDELSGTRTLLTGGGGFLGYYLVQALLEWNGRNPDREPIRLTVYENYLRGMPGWLRELRSDPHLSVVECDVGEALPEDIPAFQYVLHAASVASPTYYRKYPIRTLDANVNGLRHLLDYARERRGSDEPVRGFLFFSSSEVYGDPDPGYIPTPESYPGNVSFTGPRACYDEAKRFGETLCVNFARVHDVPVTSVRPFNNYGPGMRIDDRRVIADFARDILNGEDIVMLSDGSPTRTFCYVADAITGYFRALVRGRRGEAYNVGTREPEISIAAFAERMVAVGNDLFGYRGSVTREASDDPRYLTDNPNRRCPDIGKAREELGYEPAIGLDEGLRRTLLWYRDRNEDEAG